jgi:hypothetical protein
MTFDDLPIRAWYRWPTDTARAAPRRKLSARMGLDTNLQRLAVMNAATLEVVQVYPLTHTSDDECDVDEETGECLGCGVTHGDPCPECGQRALHTLSPLCPVLREERERAAEEPTR